MTTNDNNGKDNPTDEISLDNLGNESFAESSLDLTDLGTGDKPKPKTAEELAKEAKAKEGADNSADNNKPADADSATGVELDGKSYKLNETGDALNEDGTVFKTKDEIAALVAEDNELPVVVELQTKSGYEFKDDKGNPKVYEDTPEGIFELVNDIAEAKARENENKLLEKFPDVKEYMDFRSKGGDPANYRKFNEFDWSKVELTKDSTEDQKRGVIIESLKAKGYTIEKAQKLADMLKASSDFDTEAADALKELQDTQAQKTAQDTADLEAQIIADEKSREEFWTGVKDVVVKKGVIGSIIIPEKDRAAFYNYIAAAVDDNGRSQDQIDAGLEKTDTKLSISYMRFKKFQMADLIQNSATTQRVRTLKERLKEQSQNKFGAAGASQHKASANAVDDIRIDNLM